MSIETAEKIYEIPGVKGYRIVNQGKAEVVTLEIETDGEIELHALPVDILFYINSGEGLLYKGTENIKIKKNEKIFVEAGKERGWKNIGKETLLITGVKFMP